MRNAGKHQKLVPVVARCKYVPAVQCDADIFLGQFCSYLISDCAFQGMPESISDTSAGTMQS